MSLKFLVTNPLRLDLGFHHESLGYFLESARQDPEWLRKMNNNGVLYLSAHDGGGAANNWRDAYVEIIFDTQKQSRQSIIELLAQVGVDVVDSLRYR